MPGRQQITWFPDESEITGKVVSETSNKLTEKIDNFENTIMLIFGTTIVIGAIYFIWTSNDNEN